MVYTIPEETVKGLRESLKPENRLNVHKMMSDLIWGVSPFKYFETLAERNRKRLESINDNDFSSASDLED